VILSLQLPFAIIPLVMLTASRAKMGELKAPLWLTALAGVVAAIIVTLNINLIADFVLG
jgi:manganese transport protein